MHIHNKEERGHEFEREGVRYPEKVRYPEEIRSLRR